MDSRDERYQPGLRTRARYLYEEKGLSFREVGARMGISHQRARTLLLQAGGKPRRPGRRGGGR